MTTPRRIQLSRKKGWRMPPNTVNVARPGEWGNPIRVGGCARVEVCTPSSTAMLEATITPAIAVEFFREYIAGALRTNPDLLAPLRGKSLACWCKPDAPCHADVLLEVANKCS